MVGTGPARAPVSNRRRRDSSRHAYRLPHRHRRRPRLRAAVLFGGARLGGAGDHVARLTPLPSLLVGLGWGWLPAAAGAAAGGIAMAIAAGTSFAAGYGLALGLPAVLIPYLAYLSRPDPQDQNKREWYPLGRLVAAVALYGGSLPVLVLPLIGGSYEVLRPPMGEMLRT